MSILREVLLNQRVVGQLQFRNGCKSKILLNTSKLASCSGNFVQPRPVKFSKGSKNLHQYFSFYPLWLEPPPYFRFRNGFDSTRKGFELGNVFFYSGILTSAMQLIYCLNIRGFYRKYIRGFSIRTGTLLTVIIILYIVTVSGFVHGSILSTE